MVHPRSKRGAPFGACACPGRMGNSCAPVPAAPDGPLRRGPRRRADLGLLSVVRTCGLGGCARAGLMPGLAVLSEASRATFGHPADRAAGCGWSPPIQQPSGAQEAGQMRASRLPVLALLQGGLEVRRRPPAILPMPAPASPHRGTTTGQEKNLERHERPSATVWTRAVQATRRHPARRASTHPDPPRF